MRRGRRAGCRRREAVRVRVVGVDDDLEREGGAELRLMVGERLADGLPPPPHVGEEPGPAVARRPTKSTLRRSLSRR